MKRGSLFFAAFLLISGVLRFAGPGGAVTTSEEQGKSSPNSAGSAESKQRLKTTYPIELAEKIQEFFGAPSEIYANSAELPANADLSPNVLELMRKNRVQFAIAILPDPVHTHLGLFFGRSIEAIQQAAQAKGYVFDRAIMPWDRGPRRAESDLKTRREEADQQRQRESFPGLMIFRPGKAPGTVPGNRTLFVLVVSETPTAGLNKQQFRNALQIMMKTRVENPPPELPEDPILILGPTFSGSLESLEKELRDAALRKAYREAFVYSGTVTASGAMLQFKDATKNFAHFSSFQENDDYSRARFLQFVFDRGYKPDDIAVLSEDETVYGSWQPACQERKPEAKPPLAEAQEAWRNAKSVAPEPDGCGVKGGFRKLDESVLKLHFPREISYFRSAYQKQAAAQQSSASKSSATSTLPMDLDETGSDDDSVASYAVAQTSFSQEAVMVGIVSELQKHHIKFTLLLASDPVDDLFLASYLRRAYAQGQVVITVPDLLFAREGDPNLRGVLSLNTYSLIPGLSDRLCRQQASVNWHQDRLFVSSGNIGTFNATVGLLSEQKLIPPTVKPAPSPTGRTATAQIAAPAAVSGIPYAPYAEFGSPSLFRLNGQDYCEERPLLWLTILGRDGFWPIAGLSPTDLYSADAQIPLAFLSRDELPESTLTKGSGSYSLPLDSLELRPRTPTPWNIAYFLCLILMLVHAILSWSGSILADSEARAQFARNTDSRGTLILGIGALSLASAFVLVMCTRTPMVDWSGFRGQTAWLWLPYLFFVAATIWDLGKLRREPIVATVFTFFVCLMTGFQSWLTWCSRGQMRVYWSTRMLYLTSGVSPILPILLLLAAAYWWMWISLRGVCLVDLRRPRLPQQYDLPQDAYRVSDTEGEELRRTAHPLFFVWQVITPVLILAAMALTVLDLSHPVQTIEGKPFDWGYTILLGLLVASFLGCLLKLVRTWLKCNQVLAGLDRLPLRKAFCRINNLSWNSFWNPGGSTLRETYKVMQRALENLNHLLVLVENWETPMSEAARRTAREQIRKTLDARQLMIGTYGRIMAERKKKSDMPDYADTGPPSIRDRWKAGVEATLFVLLWPREAKREFCLNDFKQGWRLIYLMGRVEALQKEMARTAGVMIRDILRPLWEEDGELAVSSDKRVQESPLPLYRAMAEEYAALVYVNFLVSVLLRIRTLVISAGGMYVLIVLSLNTYPFEPHPALQSLAVILLLVMAGAVGYVYAAMHREVILSQLTSTKPGELGLDFWIKFLSAGALPVFSLLASQFPSINQFLFSWLEPALQAMK
jgi:hypothetical protein